MSFRGLELPPTIAPLRLAACDPAKPARPAAVQQVFASLLKPTILPYALGQPLDAARGALVAASWAASVQGWFGAGEVLLWWVGVVWLSVPT